MTDSEAAQIADLCRRFHEELRITKGSLNYSAPSPTDLTIDIERVPQLILTVANAVAQFRSGREYDVWDWRKLSNRDVLDAVNLLRDIGQELGQEPDDPDQPS